MAKREFLMLAQTHEPKKHGVAGWFVSEKLDGMRCFWDGGVTRGMLANEVPWANVEKDGRYLEPPRSTGLWTRYGKTIQAPNWWLNELPPLMLDGELYMGPGRFQEMVSTTKSLDGDVAWWQVKFMVFDMPAPGSIFADGVIEVYIGGNRHTRTLAGVASWYLNRVGRVVPSFVEYENTYAFLTKSLDSLSVVHALLSQDRLPYNTRLAQEEVEEKLIQVTKAGGEGLMLRNPVSGWRPERSWHLLKVKRLQDMEGIVVGYTWGKETDRGSKLLGKMGSLRLRMDNGRAFDLSGFTDEERIMQRIFADPDLVQDWAGGLREAEEEGRDHPGEVVDKEYYNPKFPVGARVTFTYRELTVDGLPKEARYWRRA